MLKRTVYIWIPVKISNLTAFYSRIVGKHPMQLVYADPNTYSGPDENPNFDEDDELVFMARHLGEKILNCNDPKLFCPKNVKRESYVELAIGFDDEILGYVYLFREEFKTDFTEKLVNYEFNLTKKVDNSNDYFDVYKFICEDPTQHTQCKEHVSDMNPEDSWFASEHYQRHFSHNW